MPKIVSPDSDHNEVMDSVLKGKPGVRNVDVKKLIDEYLD
jgi:hypothetical protein